MYTGLAPPMALSLYHQLRKWHTVMHIGRPGADIFILLATSSQMSVAYVIHKQKTNQHNKLIWPIIPRVDKTKTETLYSLHRGIVKKLLYKFVM